MIGRRAMGVIEVKASSNCKAKHRSVALAAAFVNQAEGRYARASLRDPPRSIRRERGDEGPQPDCPMAQKKRGSSGLIGPDA